MKKLLLLMMAVVACMSAKAGSISNGVLTINGSNDLDLMNHPSGSFHTVKLVGDFSDGWSGGWLINDGADSKSSITTIDLSEADFTKSYWSYPSTSAQNHASYQYCNWSFKNFGALQTVIWPTDPANLAVIPGHALEHLGAETISIPGYIKLIKRDAFCGVSGTDALHNIIFEEYKVNGESAVDMYIEEYAFNETAKMTDVYINTMGTIHAENIAFPLDNTYGHADPGAELATLHFPKEKASEYANLSHELDEETANDNDEFHKWLIEHFTQAGQASNGFYEFVSSGISHEDDPPISTGKFLKTFSDAEYSYIVPNGVKAYIVSNITQGTGANAGQYMLTLHRVNVIPKGTGVILYGEANSKNSNGEPTLSMTIVNYTGGAYNENSTIKNYLVGTASAAGTAVHVKPYDLGSDGTTVAYRNFFLGPFSNSSLGKKYAKEHDGKYGDYPCTGHDSSKGERVNGDFVGFWRAIESDIAAGKAYLKAPASLYGNGKGSEAIVLDQTAIDMNMGGVALYRAEYWLADKAYLSATELAQRGFWQLAVWEKDWGVRKFNATNPVFADSFGEPEFEVDGIETISEENNGENVYYNLQGVRVSQPTKGVYISNGKKYIFK
ncbi:MAG: hypothetical protein IKX22_12310 [Prevotella sp.]|nr:hypothetical protein [Prevotella sp.]